MNATEIALDGANAVIARLQAELDASQKREAVMRTALVDLVEDFETWLIDHDVDLKTQSRLKSAHKALSTPSPQGWVKLRWKNGKEKPSKAMVIVARTKYGPSAFVFHNLGPWPPMGVPGIIEWLNASELLGGGQ